MPFCISNSSEFNKKSLIFPFILKVRNYNGNNLIFPLKNFSKNKKPESDGIF